MDTIDRPPGSSRYAPYHAPLAVSAVWASARVEPANGAESRCVTLAWKMSPAAMYSSVRATASTYASGGSELDHAPSANVLVDASGSFRLTTDMPGKYRLSVAHDERDMGVVTSLLDLPIGITSWDASFESGELEVMNLPSLEQQPTGFHMLLAECGDFDFIVPLMPEAGASVLLKAVPAQRVEIRLYSRADMAGGDLLRGGRTILAVDVPVGGRDEARLP